MCSFFRRIHSFSHTKKHRSTRSQASFNPFWTKYETPCQSIMSNDVIFSSGTHDKNECSVFTLQMIEKIELASTVIGFTEVVCLWKKETQKFFRFRQTYTSEGVKALLRWLSINRTIFYMFFGMSEMNIWVCCIAWLV